MNTSRRTRRRLVLASAALAFLHCAGATPPKTLMDERTFWQLVEAAKAAAGPDHEARPQALETRLNALDLQALGAFQRRYEAFLLLSNRWDLWGAAHLMNGGCSDDGFKYFRDWLISEGRGTFERALANPESLVVFARREYFELEAFGYAALKVFERKGGGELDRSFEVETAVPAGREWKESELPAMFPKLAAKYQGR